MSIIRRRAVKVHPPLIAPCYPAVAAVQVVTPFDQPTEEIFKKVPDAIVVTGEIDRNRTDIELRRERTNIHDSLPADDIGTLPDISIADACLSVFPSSATTRIESYTSFSADLDDEAADGYLNLVSGGAYKFVAIGVNRRAMPVQFRIIKPSCSTRRKRSQHGRSAFNWRYGQAYYGKSLFWHSSELLFAFFLTEEARLPAVWMGTVLITSLLLSAGIDALVGRLLRRRSFTTERALRLQLIGALASAVSIIALFATDLLPSGGRIAYALTSALAFRIAYALFDIPQNALLGLVSPDADSRARLVSLRLSFSGLASITVATLMTALLSASQDERMGRFFIAACFMALIAVGTAYRLMVVQTPEGMRQSLPSARPRSLLFPRIVGLLAIMALVSSAISTFTMLEPFYMANFNTGISKLGIGLAAAIGLTCSQLLWLAIVRRWSAPCAMSSALLGLTVSIWLFGCAGSSGVGQLAVACMFGIANGGFGMTIWTAFSNSISERDAAGDPFAFALLTCVAKIGIALASGIVAYILSLREYLGASADSISWGMAWPPIAALGIALVMLLPIYTGRYR